jgi:energy-coupling factor transporter ATP-binding protein EcfA2
MPAIKTVTVRRFKQLQTLPVNLGEVTLLIGANNAGKSSFLQALHLAASVAQTVRLVAEGVSWAKDIFQTTVSPEQLIYSPVSDVLTLATGGRLVEGATTRIEIELQATDGAVVVVGLSRGRNRNLAVSIEGRALGERLMDFEHPFTIYAPGLAGVSKAERYLSAGVVRRIVARGDANLALRNVLRMLSTNPKSWEQYIEDMRKFFPGISIEVDFAEDTDEFVNVFFELRGGSRLPFDAAGTSILQASQILAYVSLFKPQILILDEPDSHLHPDNQRKLCQLVAQAAEERGFQAVISTHSRHVLDAMKGRSSVVWLNKGVQIPNDDINTASMLLELGALDSSDYFADGTAVRCLLVTEDADTLPVKTLLMSCGFVDDETEIASYAGSSKIEAALILGRFLAVRAPNLKVVVHRDRDYMPDEKVNEIQKKLSLEGMELFATEPSDIEGYFINAEHLHYLNSAIDLSRIVELIDEATKECEAESMTSLVNQRVAAANAAKKSAKEQVNHGLIAVESGNDYRADPANYRRGKIVIKKLASLMQSEMKSNPRIFFPSSFLKSEALSSLAGSIWGSSVTPLSTDSMIGSLNVSSGEKLQLGTLNAPADTEQADVSTLCDASYTQ